MSYISHFRSQLKKLGIFAVAAASVVSPAQIPAKRPDSDDDKERSTRPFAETEIIGSEGWMFQGEWQADNEMDERVHRYMKLEELVSEENDRNGVFWKQVKFFRPSPTMIALRGTRSDGMEFIVRRSPIEKDAFDNLCDDLNSKLGSENE